MDCYMGTVLPWASSNIIPRNWLPCDGRLMNINENQALYSLLGTIYGGNGTTTYALPDLRGRTIVGVGQQVGGSDFLIGSSGGQEGVSLATDQIPSHNHLVYANTNKNASKVAVGTNNILGIPTGDTNMYSDTANPNTNLNPSSIATTGNGVAHNNMQPFTVTNYIICIYGLYPSRG